jgi:hypothetical protein
VALREMLYAFDPQCGPNATSFQALLADPDDDTRANVQA